jgi:hypothetical protein
MKTSVFVRALAVASVALAPLASFAQDLDQAQMCADAFVAKNFPGRSPTVNWEKDSTLRYAASDTVRVRLSAANRQTGVVVATATCVAKHGVVKLSAANSSALLNQ